MIGCECVPFAVCVCYGNRECNNRVWVCVWCELCTLCVIIVIYFCRPKPLLIAASVREWLLPNVKYKLLEQIANSPDAYGHVMIVRMCNRISFHISSFDFIFPMEISQRHTQHTHWLWKIVNDSGVVGSSILFIFILLFHFILYGFLVLSIISAYTSSFNWLFPWFLLCTHRDRIFQTSRKDAAVEGVCLCWRDLT